MSDEQRITLHQKEEEAKHKIREQLAEVASFLEIAVAVFVLLGLVVSQIPLLRELPVLWHSDTLLFHEFLEHAFNLVIGIEFIKMLAKHSPGSALEVLLYAIARHMVLDSGSALENLLGVAAIGLIFVIRKYFFVPTFGATMPGGEPAPDLISQAEADDTGDEETEHA